MRYIELKTWNAHITFGIYAAAKHNKHNDVHQATQDNSNHIYKNTIQQNQKRDHE